MFEEKAITRFWSRVSINPDKHACWEWTGGLCRGGYGQVGIGGKGYRTHRVAWMIYTGMEVIPTNLLVCHMCDNPKCCNPLHLFLATLQTNAYDMFKKHRACYGEDKYNVKLTASDVLIMRSMFSTGKATLYQLADMFKVHAGTAWAAIYGRNWKHLPNIVTKPVHKPKALVTAMDCLVLPAIA